MTENEWYDDFRARFINLLGGEIFNAETNIAVKQQRFPELDSDGQRQRETEEIASQTARSDAAAKLMHQIEDLS